MAASTFTTTLNIQYTPPSASINSGVATLSVGGTYNGGQAGTIDVPASAIIGTSIPVPFGSVLAAKLFVIRNNMSSEVEVQLNGATTHTFNIPPGGEVAYIVPVSSLVSPLTSANIVTTAVPTVIEQLSYWIMGD